MNPEYLPLVAEIGAALAGFGSLAGVIGRRGSLDSPEVDAGRLRGMLERALAVVLLEGTDAFRRPERFQDFLAACAADFQGRPGFEDQPFPPAPRLRQALAAARAIDAGAVAKAAAGDIPAAIRAARLAAISRAVA